MQSAGTAQAIPAVAPVVLLQVPMLQSLSNLQVCEGLRLQCPPIKGQALADVQSCVAVWVQCPTSGQSGRWFMHDEPVMLQAPGCGVQAAEAQLVCG